MQKLHHGRRLAVAGAVMLGAVAVASTASAQRMIFATQQAGTMYYTLGSGFSKMLSDKLDRRVTVQPYSGSSVYLPLIDNGEATLGFSSSLDAGQSYAGEGRSPLKNLRAVARIWPLRVAFMVRQSSGIKTIQDLKGKRVTTDMKGQRAMGSVMQVMIMAGGLKLDDVKRITLANVGSGQKALIEGNVDATFIAVGIPLVKQAHAGIPGGVRYVDMKGPNANADFLGSKVPGVYAATLKPAARLPEVTEEITIAAFDIYLLTGAKTPDKDVQAILGALSDQFDELQKAYPPLRSGAVRAFSAPTNTVPYHAGSIAWFKSKGMWTAENDKKEASFK